MKPAIRYCAMERYQSKYTISAMSSFFGVSRSGYYAHLKRNTKEKDKELIQFIRVCQQQAGGTYGYRRVCIWLDRKGVHVNHKRVYRLMERYGLLATIRRKRKYQR
ncbi:MAG: transposase, partial [Clostridia bacterium]|nr:transposase [Clostridia bacterium]